MRSTIALIMALTGSMLAHAEIIDRILAVVAGKPVTMSELREEAAVRRALKETVPAGPALLSAVIEARLIEQEASQFPGILIEDSDVESIVAGADLSGIERARVERGARQRVLFARFFELRFKQFIRATDEELARYYTEVFVPEAARRNLTAIPDLDAVRTAIQENVIREKLDREIASWIEGLRQRNSVEILP